MAEIVAIGADVGGTKIAAGLVSASTGAILSHRAIPTRPERPGEAVLHDAVRLVEELADEARGRAVTVRGVGIGVPELVDLEGRIVTDAVVGWRHLPVAAAFSHIGPAIVESDVRAAALAEASLGAGRPFDTFAYVGVGTGISFSLVSDRTPYAGSHGAAILLGSGRLTVPCVTCGADASVVLEEAAGGPGLVSDFRSLGGDAERAEDVLAAAAAGDSRAAGVIERAGRLVGMGIGLLVNLLDPAAVVVGGGLGSAGGGFWDALLDSAREHTWYEPARDTPILQAAFGSDSGIVGAALAALASPDDRRSRTLRGAGRLR
jgi:glucokinase